MLVAGVTGFAGGLLNPPSLEDQMSRITSQMVDRAGAGGGHVVLNERVRFHAGEDDSWVVAVRGHAGPRPFHQRGGQLHIAIETELRESGASLR